MAKQSLRVNSASGTARYLAHALALIILVGLAGCGGDGKPSNKPPVASFTTVPSSGPAPLRVEVDASQSSDPNGSIVGYVWAFGDGQSATGVRATHVYATAGSYQIQLTVQDNKGAGSSATQTVAVTPSAPTAAFSAVPNSGVAPLLVSFDASASADADGSIVSYSWNFGDGTTGSGKQVTHTYGSAPNFSSSTFSVVLTVRDNSGLEGTVAQNVTVTAAPPIPPNVAPVARLTAVPATGSAPLTVAFDGSASTDVDGTITSYTWAFGDGQTATGARTQHVYATPATYTAVLSVADNAGAVGQASTTVTVASPQNQPPIAAFTSSPNGGVSPVDVTFDASASSDPDGTIVSYAWTFGDGSPAGSGKTTVHAYSTAGNHVAELTVTDNRGASARSSQVIKVTTASAYTVGGIVSGLSGTGLVLENNGADALPITSIGAFTFATPVATGATYNVRVRTQPSDPAQTCTVRNGTGDISGANVTNVTVTCSARTYTVGGTVSGLTGTGLVLQNNGRDDLPIAANLPFTFATPLVDGGAYSVTVATPPGTPSQVCGIYNASGTISGADVTSVKVICRSVFAYVADRAGGNILTYIVDAVTGALSRVGSPVSAEHPYALAVRPGDDFLYALYSGESAIPGNVRAYGINRNTGDIASAGEPVNTGLDARSIAIDPSGRFLYVANYGSNTISAYTINSRTGALTSSGAPVTAGGGPSCIAVDPTGRFAYVVNSGANTVSIFSVNGSTGALTSVGVPVATMSNPSCIVVEPRGWFAYVVNTGSSSISAYAVDATTGGLTSIGIPTPTGGLSPRFINVDPDGKFIYATNFGSASVAAFTLIQNNGVLLPAGGPAPAGANASSVTVDPTGRFVYVTNSGAGTVSAYRIDGTTGALTAIGANVAAGADPTAIATTR
jgi:PKD repeat protein